MNLPSAWELPIFFTTPSFTATTGSALAGEDVDALAAAVRLDHVGRVLTGLDALGRCLLLEVVGVARLG